MLKTLWPARQTLNLGNLLTFRMEIEMLCKAKNTSEALLYFTGIPSETQHQISYFHELIASSIFSIHPIFGDTVAGEVDWPPRDPEIEKWSYGSFKRVNLLFQKTQQFPILNWSSHTLTQAQKILSDMRNHHSRKVLAVHLKRQSGGPEESNAELNEWVNFFSENQNKTFFLLGSDFFPPQLLLPNTVLASQLGTPLAVQLAFCAICDGFMGMAAGISTAACLSLTPYVIFKHPAHHVEEMKVELGDADCLSFARSCQKLWRKAGTLEYLNQGLKALDL